jgi:hypothetical protein
MLTIDEENKLQKIQELVNGLAESVSYISDGYHSFSELYEFRKVYNALLFNEWAKNPKLTTEWIVNFHGLKEQRVISREFQYEVHKSLRHHDGELCFGGGWFIVVAVLPSGQISNHYKVEDWDLFQIPEVEKAKYEFDGHTSKDSLERMLKLIAI